MGWKAAPRTDPWEEEPPAKPDPWATASLLVALIVVAVIAVSAVAALYIYLVIRGSG